MAKVKAAESDFIKMCGKKSACKHVEKKMYSTAVWFLLKGVCDRCKRALERGLGFRIAWCWK